MILPPEKWRKKSGSQKSAKPSASADRPSFEGWFFACKIRRPDLSGSDVSDQLHRCGTVPGCNRTSLGFALHIISPMYFLNRNTQRDTAAYSTEKLCDVVDNALNAINQVVIAKSKRETSKTRCAKCLTRNDCNVDIRENHVG